MPKHTYGILVNTVVTVALFITCALILPSPAFFDGEKTDGEVASFHFFSPSDHCATACSSEEGSYSSEEEMGFCCSEESKQDCSDSMPCDSGSCCLITDMLHTTTSTISNQLEQGLLINIEQSSAEDKLSFVFRPPKNNVS